MQPNDIRDVRPPVELPFQLNFLYIIIAILILVGSWVLFYLLKNKTNKIKEVVVLRRPPQEIALEQLELLRKENLLSQGKLNTYYSKLSNIVRYYFEGEFKIKAPEMTTEEFLIFLQTSEKLEEVMKALLKDFLISCDMVKFAKHVPSNSEAEASFNLAKKIISPS